MLPGCLGIGVPTEHAGDLLDPRFLHESPDHGRRDPSTAPLLHQEMRVGTGGDLRQVRHDEHLMALRDLRQLRRDRGCDDATHARVDLIEDEHGDLVH